MTNEEIFALPSIAYFSGLNGLEIKHFEHGIEDHVYCVSNCWYGSAKAKKVHRAKIQYDNEGRAYFKVHGHKIPLDECIRM